MASLFVRPFFGPARKIGLLVMAMTAVAHASHYGGQVVFNGQPLPGATVTATQGAKTLAVVSDAQGFYTFADLPDGTWTISVQMLCFAPLTQQVPVGKDTPAGKWEMKLLPLDRILALATAPKVEPQPVLSVRTQSGPGKSDAPLPGILSPPDDSPRPSDGLLLNGSIANAATSQFSIAQAIGNTRSSKRLYTGSVGLLFDNSAFDARPYSITGFPTPKASYNRFTGFATFGGPLNIPHLLPHGPNFFLAYQWTRNRDQSTLSGLVPDAAERAGNLAGDVNPAGQPLQIINPATGQPFAGDVVSVSPQAQALLALYPLPNLAGNTLYNYQTQAIGNTHQDAMQLRMDKTIGRKDSFFGNLAFQSIRAGNQTLFGFVDTTDTLGLNSAINWSHRFNRKISFNVGYRFSRLRTEVIPQFENRQNISGQAGIGGNDQDPADYGPPTLSFSSGIAGLTDVESEFNRNRTDALSVAVSSNHARHSITAGGDLRRQEFNVFSQQDSRGSFAFTGAATAQVSAAGLTTGGSDLADFLLGTPDTSSIAFGNPDKYLRESVYDLFVTDDYRIRPELTFDAGMRWEYGAPITELQGRLVNLDIQPGFAAVAPVLASAPKGPLTGLGYPTSLIRPDKLGFEPRVGLSWRPIPGSTLVVRAGYGIYDDTSIYHGTALQLAQQAPLSKSLDVDRSASCPLTLANGFIDCAGITADTFAVDPNLRVGYAQSWQLSAQRDLPAALVATASYSGVKGTHGLQDYLPQTYPIGAYPPFAIGPSGYIFQSSTSDSIREAASLQLRRRLKSGFTATAQYTYSKSVDDDSVLGGAGGVAAGAAAQTSMTATIAQNWLNLRGERSLSTFDQRHLLNAQIQYTSGQGIGGGTLLTGRRGTLLKEWTVLATINAGTGLPETPIYFAAQPGTGVTGTIRPDGTGAPLYAAPAGLHLNPAAYVAPVPGQYGTAGRNSILGPGQFTCNSSLARTFQLRDSMSLDLRLDSANTLNHVVFTAWNTIVNGTTFGEPVSAKPMRSIQTTLRLRY